MALNDEDLMRSLGERASILPLRYQAENAALKAELAELYKREVKLLKIIDKRDEQLEQVAHGKSIKLPSKKKQLQRPVDRKQIESLKNDLEILQRRYEALKKSKLGRLQLWYWRKKAGR